DDHGGQTHAPTTTTSTTGTVSDDRAHRRGRRALQRATRPRDRLARQEAVLSARVATLTAGSGGGADDGAAHDATDDRIARRATIGLARLARLRARLAEVTSTLQAAGAA